MGDSEYEKLYLKRKQELRAMHKRLKNSRDIQEIYHKLMGSDENDPDSDQDF